MDRFSLISTLLRPSAEGSNETAQQARAKGALSLQNSLFHISNLLNHTSYLGLWISPNYYCIADFIIENIADNPNDIQ